MFPKEKKKNIKLDKLVVKKFPQIFTMSLSPVSTANHRVFRYFMDVTKIGNGELGTVVQR